MRTGKRFSHGLGYRHLECAICMYELRWRSPFSDSQSAAYSILHNFAGGASDGLNPWYGGPVFSGSTLYGMTAGAGLRQWGSLWASGCLDSRGFLLRLDSMIMPSNRPQGGSPWTKCPALPRREPASQTAVRRSAPGLRLRQRRPVPASPPGGRHLIGRVHVPPAHPAPGPGNRVLLRLTPGRLGCRSGGQTDSGRLPQRQGPQRRSGCLERGGVSPGGM